MAKLNLGRALLAGIVGTAAMTMLMLAAPLMGMPRMSIGEMLGSFLHIGSAAGWAMHGVIGLVLAVTPMMGGGVFSGGNMAMIVGSLMGHLVYGALVGAVYGGGAKASEVLRA
jgi:hypothetical protein